MSAPEGPLKRTPLNQTHRALGAKMVPFGGWDMPVQYSGILDEHRAVRMAAGLFDVSHMGEIEIAGPEALPALQRLITNDASQLAPGQVQYAALTTPNGTFVDDLTVYRLGESQFMLTVNAANIEKDFAWIRENLKGRATPVNVSDETALIALQGPKAQEILQPLTPVTLGALKYYWFTSGRVAGLETRISRTGYTGEDGFEIYLPAVQAERLWEVLLAQGKGAGLLPCGLGARDTLRLEAKMALYGNDIDDRHTVLEADLGWIVKWEKGEFIGREVLARQKAEGVPRRLVGFEMVGRGIGRSHYRIVKEGRPIGEVTSGGPAPFLGKAIGLGYVETPFSAVGTEFDVLIREQPVRARVVPTPFYKRPKK